MFQELLPANEFFSIDQLLEERFKEEMREKEFQQFAMTFYFILIMTIYIAYVLYRV